MGPFAEGALYTLLLLQREGRLVDFLQEDLGGLADDQIGAAARRIHADCAKVLQEHFQLGRVLPQDEGQRVELPGDADPAQVRLTGNVPDAGPYRGTLQHSGWRAQEVSLPTRTGCADPRVVQPAVLEI